MSTAYSRRAFFGTVTGLAAMAPLAAQEKSPTWDLAWLDQFKGKHKQMFDLGGIELENEDSPLRLPNNYLNTFRDVLHAEGPDVNVAIGIAGGGFSINASDALWEKFKFGEVWKIKDPETGKPAIRNIYLGAATGNPSPTVRSLMARGVAFWQCNIALGNLANRLARSAGVPADKMRAELIAGLNPGVHLVPAHSMATGLAQERGFTYMKG
jgi:hypothetical protein